MSVEDGDATSAPEEVPEEITVEEGSAEAGASGYGEGEDAREAEAQEVPEEAPEAVADETKEAEIRDPKVVALKAKIKLAFDIFDHDKNSMCDVREVGTIVRSLGMTPTEARLASMIQEIEQGDLFGFVQYKNFEDLMITELQKKVDQDMDALLIKALQTLDVEGKGYIPADEMTRLMTEEGEPFSQEEMEEMLSAAVDVEKGAIFIEDYIPLLCE